LAWEASHFERIVVVGDSMAPALLPGDRLLVRKLGGLFGRAVRQGDVAVAPDPRQAGRALVKRVAKVDSALVWLAGDNPDRSTDSRDFGPLPLAKVTGRAVYRYAPATRAGRLGASPRGAAERSGPAPGAQHVGPSKEVTG
jgi:nickel-type superoxide dismutase maturation protease